LTDVRVLARCKLDLRGVQEVRWDKGGNARAGDYTFLYAEDLLAPQEGLCSMQLVNYLVSSNNQYSN
jgi:hypothetical protein